MREDLAVQVKHDRLSVQRGKADVEVFSGEIRHLLSALVETAAGLVGQEAQEGSRKRQRVVTGGWMLSWQPAYGGPSSEKRGALSALFGCN